jgi:DNA-binding MurR/RpiR family transcriptional regulator
MDTDTEERDGATGGAEALSALIARHQATFTKKERQIARVLTTASPTIGLTTVAEFARTADTSTATILRFLTKIGFGNYAEFQDRLREEVTASLESPLARYQASDDRATEGSMFARYVEWSANLVRQTEACVPATEFQAVVDSLANPKSAIYVVGGRFSRSLAELMCYGLSGIRRNVHRIQDDTREMVDVLLAIKRQDVVVVFDFRRYQQSIIRFSKVVASMNATLVVITDQWQSPSARVATHVLALPVASPSIFDSAMAPLMCVEAIVARLAEQQGEGTEDRATTVDDLYMRLSE